MNIKKIIAAILVIPVFWVLMVLFTTGVKAAPVWFQGFETDTSGWFDIDDVWYGQVTRVVSGTDGVSSYEGSWHAIFEGDNDSGPFSRFDGYRDTWTEPWKAEVAVYLDPSWDAGTGFDYSVAATGSDGNHQRDFIFHVTKDTSTGKLLVGGSNNTNFAPREDLENIDHYEVTTAGWYVLQHVFRNEGGILAVDLNLLDPDRTILFTETRTDASDTIPTEVGGNRYAWFTFINVPNGISVDAHSLEFLVFGCMDSEAYNYNPEANLADDSCLYVVASVNGGGHVLGNELGKKKDQLDVSFGTWLKKLSDNSLVGDLQVNLHNVENPNNDEAQFHGSDIVSANFYIGDDISCNDAVNYTVSGNFNGVEGFSATFRAGDDGSPNTKDTVRITIFHSPNGTGSPIFDTFIDFSGGSNCVGTARTELDNGNITIWQE